MSHVISATVMAGLGPAIHDFSRRRQVVNTRPKGGHDAFAFVKRVIP
jgi:hypothetical protein